MNRLILIEGIPGSGKTTLAGKAKDFLESQGYQVRLYREGDLHPADLAWQSVISLASFEKIRKLPELQERLEGHVSIEGDRVVVAYTKLGLPDQAQKWMKYFEDHEVYDQRVPFAAFKSLHLSRWKRFGQNADPHVVYIFECAYLQNHISEMLRAYEMEEEAVIRYMQELMETVRHLNPKLIYLSQPDIRATLQRVAAERRSPDPDRCKDWIDLVAAYVEESPYGQAVQLQGFEAVASFMQERKTLEMKVMAELEIEIVVIENPAASWSDVELELMSRL